jgi:hypothetical protein
MPSEESNETAGKQNPPVPPNEIGKHKSPEVDALQLTPERKAKTGEKS